MKIVKTIDLEAGCLDNLNDLIKELKALSKTNENLYYEVEGTSYPDGSLSTARLVIYDEIR